MSAELIFERRGGLSPKKTERKKKVLALENFTVPPETNP
jgi:hypothetical protein